MTTLPVTSEESMPNPDRQYGSQELGPKGETTETWVKTYRPTEPVQVRRIDVSARGSVLFELRIGPADAELPVMVLETSVAKKNDAFILDPAQPMDSGDSMVIRAFNQEIENVTIYETIQAQKMS